MTISTSKEFFSFINHNKWAFIECVEESSGYCIIMAPILQKMEKIYSEVIASARVNLEYNSFIVNGFYISESPTYLLFHNGLLVEKLEGLIPFAALIEKIEKHINKT